MDTPPSNDALFDQLQAAITTQGVGPAIEELLKTLEVNEDYQALFYATLLGGTRCVAVPDRPGSRAAE
jgi:hypothetical protein